MKLDGLDINPANKKPILALLAEAEGLKEGEITFNFFVNDKIAVRVTTQQDLRYGLKRSRQDT